MFRSMTAFGRARETVGTKDITAEIKSVNNRYFDCTVKITRLYSFLEDKIKKYLSEKGISRGKVEVYVGIDLLEKEGVEISLDTAYAKSYIDALCKLRDTFDLKDDITVSRVASNHDVFITKKPEDDIEKDWVDIKPVLDKAIDAFLERRNQEGENLYRNIVESQEVIDYIVQKYFPEVRENENSSNGNTIYTPTWKKGTDGKIELRPTYPPIPDGTRNLSLTSLAGQWHSTGYTKEDIYKELLYVNSVACNPPLDINEIQSIVNSVTRYRR